MAHHIQTLIARFNGQACPPSGPVPKSRSGGCEPSSLGNRPVPTSPDMRTPPPPMGGDALCASVAARPRNVSNARAGLPPQRVSDREHPGPRSILRAASQAALDHVHQAVASAAASVKGGETTVDQAKQVLIGGLELDRADSRLSDQARSQAIAGLALLGSVTTDGEEMRFEATDKIAARPPLQHLRAQLETVGRTFEAKVASNRAVAIGNRGHITLQLSPKVEAGRLLEDKVHSKAVINQLDGLQRMMRNKEPLPTSEIRKGLYSALEVSDALQLLSGGSRKALRDGLSMLAKEASPSKGRELSNSRQAFDRKLGPDALVYQLLEHALELMAQRQAR